MVASFVVAPMANTVDAGAFITEPVRLLLTGFGLGVFQGLILRRYIVQADRWMWATFGGVGLLGGVINLSILLVLAATDREIPFLWVGAAVFLLLFLVQLAVFGVTGLMQWLILRAQVLRAGRWITATIVAHLLGMAVGILSGLGIGYLFYWLEVDGGIGIRFIAYRFHLFEVAGGAVAGAITGAVLVRLLRQPVPGERTAAA